LIKPTLTVLSRTYCHLCEDMIAALEQFQGRYSFEIDVVDVDSNPRLEEKWGDKVPVLLDGDRELCHYFLDIEVLDARLARMK
jgi:thiol-disulfide isomerase/thioredoxin